MCQAHVISFCENVAAACQKNETYCSPYFWSMMPLASVTHTTRIIQN